MLKLIRSAFSVLDAGARRDGLKLSGMILLAALLEGGGVGLIFPLIRIAGDHTTISTTPQLAAIRDFLVLSDRSFVFLAIAGVALVAIFKNILSGFNVFYQFKFVFQNETKLSLHLFRHYLTLPWALATHRTSAEMLTVCQRSVYNTCSNVILATIILMTEISAGIAVLAVMLLLAPLVTLASGLVLALFVGVFLIIFRKRFVAYGKRDFALVQVNIKHLQQSFLAAKEIRALGRAAFFIDGYEKLRQETNRNHMVYMALSQMPRLFLESIAVLAMLLVMSIIFASERQTQDQMAVLALFAVAAFRLMPATNKIIFYIGQIRAAETHVGRVLADFTTESIAQGKGEEDKSVPAFYDSIVLDKVSFAYPGSEKAVLCDVSLKIAKGQSLALIGGSGAGKTTLADLILGLLTPTSGRILIDGIDATSHLETRRRIIGYVPQQVYLLDDTLRKNIAFGIPEQEIDEQRVHEAIRQAQLEQVVTLLSDGIETRVGENGVLLSGGQRQRIGIARALYHHPQILVLDEATSALDNETEKEVTEAVASLRGQMTLIVIAHRLSTVRKCNQLVLLEAGHISDIGTFEELLGRSSLMKRFVELGQLTNNETA